MTAMFVVAMILPAQIVLVFQMVIAWKICVVRVMQIAPMTVFKIVLVNGVDALEDSTRRLERSGISAGITPWSATEPLAYVSFAKPSDRTIGQTQVASWCAIVDDDDVECIDRRLKKFCAAPADRNGSAKTSGYSGELDSIKAALAAIGDVISCIFDRCYERK